MNRDIRFGAILGLLAVLLLGGCGNGRSGGGGGGIGPLGAESPVTVAGVSPTLGIFDPSLTEVSSNSLWMSYSTVNVSSNDPILPNVSTRIASSINRGRTWTDVGSAPNFAQDVPVFDNTGLILLYWTTWQFEVSRLVYDGFDSDPNRRWKLLWHRYLQSAADGVAARLFQHGWIGYSTAPNATGPWSSERKLFVGSLYDSAANDSVIGPPEYNLATVFPDLSSCAVFTEPGMLATASGVYISLHCASASAGASGKVVLLRCTGTFAPNNCTYRGDLLTAGEAQQFAPTGQTYTGFSATDLVAVGNRNFLIVTPTSSDEYRGCLVFEIASLDNATLIRSSGNPVLLKRIGGSAATGFHGACGYTPGATVTGIIYGKFAPTANPLFRLFDTDVQIP